MNTPRVTWLRTTCVLGILGAVSAASWADDRDLLRLASADPYVFILFDVSGSMNWTPQCTQEDLDAGVCDYLCTGIDCTPRAMGDDPASKMRQAKEAIHEVLEEVENVHFGFATYNQNDLRARYKHWLYRARSNGPALAGSEFWPRTGAIETFGQDFGCDSGDNDFNIPCYASWPADLNDAWEVERALRAPKLGTAGTDTDYIYVRSAGTRYRIRYQRNAGNLGDATIDVRYLAERCNNSDCSSRTSLPQVTVTLERVTDFFHWESSSSGGRAARRSYFPNEQDHSASGTCNGWDPNTDTSSDDYGDDGSENIKQTTISTDPRGSRFHVGDVIPLDWNTDNRALIQSRLAPNGVDFTQASYFQDTPGASSILHLRNDSQKPLLAQGSTPLGASMSNFRDWWRGTSSNPGWSDIAALQDPDWVCRKKYLIVVTDGDETCNGSPATVAGNLNQPGNDRVRTYVVGFGLQTSTSLNAIAASGGTTAPIFPQNKQELIDALTSIFGAIQEETRAFASATVPSVQADISDRVYLSRFLPFDDEPVWSGGLDAFLKPVPLNDEGQPDREASCSAGLDSSCFLWDAGEQLLAQNGMGLADNQRRVFYVRDLPTSSVPATKRPLQAPAGDPGACSGYPPSGCSEWWDLFFGFGLDPTRTPASLATDAGSIIDTTLAEKVATYEVTDPDTGEVTTREERFKLGDLFHSDPTYVERPLDFELLARDLYGNDSTCDAEPPNHNRGYRCFADKHRLRRKTVFVGANDGMIHAIDAGTFEGPPDTGTFNTGTGRELFAVMPRTAMPIVRDQADGDEQIYSMDGAPRVGDAFIDPIHNGAPDEDDREWRTILVAGMREGGNKFPSQEWVPRFEHVPGQRMRNAYIAIDITQPDPYDSDGVPPDDVVPACLRLNSSIPADCGVLSYPTVLWEYGDLHPTTRVPMDEDLNTRPDLGDTWSRPILGRVRTDAGNREVAVFGGGMDTPFRNGTIGNWIYMVDIETGRTLYKRRIIGAVPGEIAAQDRDNDAFLDTLYFGTTAGLVYKVDLRTVGTVANVTVRDLNGTALTQARITNADWEPFPIFQTGPAGAAGPIFHGPTVFYVARAAKYALAFGTGDRENLWSEVYGAGRFYVMLDTGFTQAQYLSGALPRTEDSYIAVDPDGPEASVDRILGGSGGWYFTLGEDERVITRAAGLAGLLNFTAFQPQVDFVDVDEDQLCARTGLSRIFGVNASNGNALGLTVEGDPRRYMEVRDFTTAPTLEQVHTKNQPSGGTEIEPWDEDQQRVIASVMSFFPEGTRFANYYYQLTPRTSRNEQVKPIPIPIGIIVSNWKEF